ncbi:MAG: hypothetical protein ACOZAM_15885 [Pseudomonadota bacterium]
MKILSDAEASAETDRIVTDLIDLARHPLAKGDGKEVFERALRQLGNEFGWLAEIDPGLVTRMERRLEKELHPEQWGLVKRLIYSPDENCRPYGETLQ